MEKCSSGARSRVPGVRGWEAGQATRAETRYRCLLPDPSGWARRPSAANLPKPLYQAEWPPRQGRATRIRQPALALAMRPVRVSARPMKPPNFYAANGLDRAGHRRREPEWL